MRKVTICSLILIVIIAVMVSCAENMDSNLNQTGLLDQNGNLITNTLIFTNRITFNSNIPEWSLNISDDYIIITNIMYLTNYDVIYKTNYYLPNLPDSPTDYYRVRVPFAVSGSDYVTVSYKDIPRIKQLWLDQIKRKGSADKEQNVFAIRNRDNDGGFWFQDKNFQSMRNGIYDYYYFADNGDIYYKGGDKNNKNKAILVKKFVGAAIVDYLKAGTIEDLRNRTGEWTIGGIYKMAIDVNEARERFKGGGVIEGVYDFIAAPDTGAYLWGDVPKFMRQFYNTNFIEILVLNPYNNNGQLNCLGVDSYYAYFGDTKSREHNKEGAYPPIKGFTEKNMPWMTEENLYMAARPEGNVAVLNRWAFFTGQNKNIGDFEDYNKNWKFLAMPGNAY